MRAIFYLFFFLLSSSISLKAQLLELSALDTIVPYVTMEEALREPEKVVKLSLRKEKLKEFPIQILQFKNLQYLDLGKNKISSLPENIDSLTLLQVLIIEKNNIDTLPKSIGNLSNLRVLNANNNELSGLPPSIGKLSNLETLDLWSNNLDYFPDELKYLKSLKVLDLRVILLNEKQQQRITSLLPHAKIYFSPSCHCGN